MSTFQKAFKHFEFSRLFRSRSHSGSVAPPTQNLMAMRPPKHSMNLNEWSEAVCGVVGTRKAASDATAMFKYNQKSMKYFIT